MGLNIHLFFLSFAYSATLTGFFYAWPSYTIANFESNATLLSRPMSSGEVAILGSLTNIGALLATPFFGYAINTFGRKYAAMLIGVPYVLAWLIISVTTCVPLVIAAMGLAGLGAAGQVLSTVYISEIAQDSIRGGLTSATVSGYLLGLLFSYILGGYLTYYQVIYTHLSLSVLYMVMLTMLKESAVFLVQKGNYEEAAKSISFYRRVEPTSKEVENEINKIKMQLDPRIDKVLQGEQDPAVLKELISSNVMPQEKPESSWKFLRMFVVRYFILVVFGFGSFLMKHLTSVNVYNKRYFVMITVSKVFKFQEITNFAFKSESSKRALVTVLILMTLSILMGGLILQVYAEPLFKEAVPSMPSNMCAILLAVDLMVASLLFAVIVDRAGRKLLMTWTSGGTGVCALVLGAQLHLRLAPHWVTAVLIYLFCFISNLGCATVPFILPAEVFLPEVRSLCNSITMTCMWITNFVTLMIFKPMVENLGLGPLFYGFCVICFLAALYSHLCLPETRGLSADAIQLLFIKKKKVVIEFKLKEYK